MGNRRVRLSLESLDNRDVPSVSTISFSLPTGGLASGSFTFPEEQVDPTQTNQDIPVTDLTLMIGTQIISGAAFTSQPSTTISNGLYLGLSFSVGEIAGSGLQYLGGAGGAVTAITSAGLVSTTLSTTLGVPSSLSIPTLPGPLTIPPGTLTPDADALAQLKLDYDLNIDAMNTIRDSALSPEVWSTSNESRRHFAVFCIEPRSLVHFK